MIKNLFFILFLILPTGLLSGEPGNQENSNESMEKNSQEILKENETKVVENQIIIKNSNEDEKISENVETKNELSTNNEIVMVKENNFQCYDSAAGENPFLRDLSDELLKRQDNGACVYPLDTFRVVGILDSKNQGKTLQNKKSKLALVQIPNNKDQIVISEGQILGSKGGIVKEIDFDSIVVEEEGNLVRLEVLQ